MHPEEHTAARQRAGKRLRDLRGVAGLSGLEVAGRVPVSQPKLSKIENGRTLPSAEDLAALLELYHTPEETRRELEQEIGRLRMSVESNRSILRRGAARRQMRIGEIESTATVLRYLVVGVVPGLLQTEAYTRHVFSVDLTGDDLDAAVAARQRRGDVLQDTSKRFEFLLAESVVRWRYAPDPIMAEQMQRIAQLSHRRHISVGVVPYTVRVGDVPQHGFEMFDEHLVTVGLEHGVVEVTDPRDIAVYTRMWRLMHKAALRGTSARDYLLERQTDFEHCAEHR